MDEPTPTGNVLFVMGAAGAGKTTIARQLAARLDFDFIEGDAFHPPANVAKIRAGVPLDDVDRAPWLEALRQALLEAVAGGRSVAVACSGLRRVYRRKLLDDLADVAIVYLDGNADLLHDRIAHRAGHYMPEELVESQLDTMEPPAALRGGEPLAFGPWTDRALFIDAAATVDEIVETVLDRLDREGDRAT